MPDHPIVTEAISLLASPLHRVAPRAGLVTSALPAPRAKDSRKVSLAGFEVGWLLTGSQ